MRLLLALCFIVPSFGAAALAATPASPTPAPVAGPTAPSDAVVEGWARSWLRGMQTGNIDRSQLDDQMNAALTPDTVKSIQPQLDALGEPIAVTQVNKVTQGGYTAYIFRLRFDNGNWTEYLTLDSNYKVAGLRFTPGP